jgi:hypothetical protein
VRFEQLYLRSCHLRDGTDSRISMGAALLRTVSEGWIESQSV